MRYGLISDIHGNLEAFRAVLDSLSSESIDEYICIGDVVGYGADPQASIRLVRSLKPKVLIAGNHDWGVVDLTDLEYFNEYAKAAVIWTKGTLERDDIDYLKSFRLVYEEEAFTLVHGSLESPGDFNYILNSEDAYITVKMMRTPLCFIGHTHVPGVFSYDDGRVEYAAGSGINIKKPNKYIVNVGSVGQPRDGNPAASYAIYDDDEGTVKIKRVEYDIESAQQKILRAGLPRYLAMRLSYGR